MKLLGSTKEDVDSDKNSENVPKLESVEVVLLHCNLVKNDYQHTSKVLFSFVPNKQFGQLINISPHSLTMMNKVNTEFSFVEVWFTDQISKALEIEDNLNLTLNIDINSDQSEGNYDVNKEIRIKTSILRSDLCDYSNAYIIVKGTITIVRPNNAKRNKEVIFKKNAPFINCISKINGVKIDNAEDLDVVMPMYNLLEYSKNCKKKQVIYGIIIEMNQVILFLLILSLLNIKQVLQEKLIILVLVKKVMMQIKMVKMKLNLLFH